MSVGRNDLCPCGSGQKFKRCCLGVVPGQHVGEKSPEGGTALDRTKQRLDDDELPPLLTIEELVWFAAQLRAASTEAPATLIRRAEQQWLDPELRARMSARWLATATRISDVAAKNVYRDVVEAFGSDPGYLIFRLLMSTGGGVDYRSAQEEAIEVMDGSGLFVEAELERLAKHQESTGELAAASLTRRAMAFIATTPGLVALPSRPGEEQATATARSHT
jgi:hypothetical protein